MENQLEILSKKLNESVLSVINNDAAKGFEKAYIMGSAISELKTLLTPEYMAVVMSMQGNKLGFKTDKDSSGGYSVDMVRNCLIEAVLFGLEVCGNQFNIIAGNMYVTKEGCGYLLSKIKGLQYDIISELPRVKEGSAAIVMNVNYTINGVTKEKKLDIPIKVNNFMGTDAIIGKATRKARKWLYDAITGSELPEGDATDISIFSIKPSLSESTDISETKAILDFIENAKSLRLLDAELFDKNLNDECKKAYEAKKIELTPKK
jgi:hypothetical protein